MKKVEFEHSVKSQNDRTKKNRGSSTLKLFVLKTRIKNEIEILVMEPRDMHGCYVRVLGGRDVCTISHGLILKHSFKAAWNTDLKSKI